MPNNLWRPSKTDRPPSYTEKPKYRCPRCQTQTCSLPCYKKHQQRASCNGQRDPSAYLKKSQLATPSGLDRDYNYLKNVERSINHANSETHDRGIGIGSASASKNVAKGWHAQGRLQQYLTANQITLERAPMGMSRQRNNITRATKGGQLMWTVEWATVQGPCGLQQDCPESSTITDLYAVFLEPRGRLDPNERRGKKRKRAQADAQAHVKDEHTTDEKPLGEADSRRPPDAIGHEPAPETEPHIKTEPHTKTEPNDDDTESLHTRPDEPTTTAENASHQHFYLAKPATATSSRVLIPISGTATLTACLSHQTVQEYPTIYVLDTADTEALPSGFISEKEYTQSRRQEDGELQKLLRHSADSQPIPRTQAATKEEEQLDAQGILNMLRRDVPR